MKESKAHTTWNEVEIYVSTDGETNTNWNDVEIYVKVKLAQSRKMFNDKRVKF